MSVRTKFVCTTRDPGDTGNVSFAPVHKIDQTTGDNSENEAFGKWTPCGSISLTINNPDAFKQFSSGDYYYVDFSLAETFAEAQAKAPVLTP